jgi:hypothetical protein
MTQMPQSKAEGDHLINEVIRNTNLVLNKSRKLKYVPSHVRNIVRIVLECNTEKIPTIDYGILVSITAHASNIFGILRTMNEEWHSEQVTQEMEMEVREEMERNWVGKYVIRMYAQNGVVSLAKGKVEKISPNFRLICGWRPAEGFRETTLYNFMKSVNNKSGSKPVYEMYTSNRYLHRDLITFIKKYRNALGMDGVNGIKLDHTVLEILR